MCSAMEGNETDLHPCTQTDLQKYIGGGGEGRRGKLLVALRGVVYDTAYYICKCLIMNTVVHILGEMGTV